MATCNRPMDLCKNSVGGWYHARRCRREATGEDGLCNVCRGMKKRSMNRLRREREWRESRRGDG